MLEVQELNFQCLLLKDTEEKISMSHGGGGKLMHQLIKKHLQPLYADERYSQHDSAVLNLTGQRIAFTTDSFVVNPIFFPGGDIGKLAVCGTINDLAMSGATPKYISFAVIIEEGLPISSFEKVLESLSRTAHDANIEIVTGDTKVVERAKGDKIYLNTTGIGYVRTEIEIHPERIASGDAVIVSGDIGRHGVAVMSGRDGTSAAVSSGQHLYLHYKASRYGTFERLFHRVDR